MAELGEVEQTKTVGFMPKAKGLEDRIKEDEAEIERLEKEARGESQEEGDEENSGEEEGPEPTTPEEKTWKKRYADLRRHNAKENKKLQDKIDSLSDKVENSVSVDRVSEEELESWMEEYPDVAKMVEGMAAKIADERMAETKTIASSLREDKEEANRAKEEAKIYKKHPDFDDLQEDDKFHDWLEAQPKLLQDAIYEGSDAASAIRVIDLYKQENKPKKKTGSAAESVSTRGKSDPDVNAEKGVIRESDVQKMSDKDYEKNEEKINEAMRSGKFVYDISGGAR